MKLGEKHHGNIHACIIKSNAGYFRYEVLLDSLDQASKVFFFQSLETDAVQPNAVQTCKTLF